MKIAIAAGISALFLATAAHAEDAYPAYTKDKDAWWVSALFLAPVTALDAVGRAIEVTARIRVPLSPSTRPQSVSPRTLPKARVVSPQWAPSVSN